VHGRALRVRVRAAGARAGQPGQESRDHRLYRRWN